jgi:hypothetical protein
MPFTIKTKTTIESATIQLTGLQLQDLANAREPLEQLIAEHHDHAPELTHLAPLRLLLQAITELVANTTIAPSQKKPQSQAQIESRLANAVKARAAKAARLNPLDGQPDENE